MLSPPEGTVEVSPPFVTSLRPVSSSAGCFSLHTSRKAQRVKDAEEGEFFPVPLSLSSSPDPPLPPPSSLVE